MATAHDLQQHVNNLQERDREFALSLIEAADKSYGLSEKQEYWVNRLYQRATGETITGLTRIVEMFDNAATKIKYPKVKFYVDGEPIRFSRAGDRSKHEGCINVTDGRPFGENVYYGRITRDGTMTLRECAKGLVEEVIRKFAADPEEFSANYGRNSGACCYCNRELTDARSTEVGYGPVCADNYGLPWGNKNAERHS